MRFEVVGTLRGTLVVMEPATVVNISATGALLHTSSPVPLGSVQTLQVSIDGQPTRVTARVKRAAPLDDPPGMYAIGVEFLPVSAPIAHSLAEGLLHPHQQ